MINMGYRILIVVFALVGLVRGSSEVKVRHTFYSCCGKTLEFNPRWDHTWTINQTNIAHIDQKTHSCTPPCRTVGDGVLTLDSCVDVNVTVGFQSGPFRSEELLISHGEQCSDVAAVQSGGGWFLLVAFIAGFFLTRP